MLKGFGQPATENNGSGAEDNISDTDDESMDGASVSLLLNNFEVVHSIFSHSHMALLVVFVKWNFQLKEKLFRQIFQFIRQEIRNNRT